MAKTVSIKTEPKVADTASSIRTTKPKHQVFDATKTLAALKIIAKKRDPKLRKEILTASLNQIKSPPKFNPILPGNKGLFFNSSIPVKVTPEAQNIIQQLKCTGHEVIKFPGNMNDGGEVICIDNSVKPTTKKVIGIFRKLCIVTDPMIMDISQCGLFVKTLENEPKLLEFMVKVPSLPGILRSSKFNDEGGLTHQLQISHGKQKKGE